MISDCVLLTRAAIENKTVLSPSLQDPGCGHEHRQKRAKWGGWVHRDVGNSNKEYLTPNGEGASRKPAQRKGLQGEGRGKCGGRDMG